MRTVPTKITIGQRYRQAVGGGWTHDPTGYGPKVSVVVRYKATKIAVLVDECMVDRMIARRVVGSDVVVLCDVNPRRGTVAAMVVPVESVRYHEAPIDDTDDHAVPVYDLSGDPACDLFFHGEEWERAVYPDATAWNGAAWGLDDLTAIRIIADIHGALQ